MNNLSWLLYLADVLPGVGSNIGFFVFFGILFSGAAYGFGFAATTFEKEDKELIAAGKAARKFGRNIFLPACVIGLLISAIPGKNTFYMIAASEAGEQLIDAPETQRYLSDIKEILDKKIAGMK